MKQVWLYRISILWGALFIFDSIATSIWMSLQNVEWAKLSGQARFLVVIAIGKGVFSAVMAYLSKAATRIEEGKLPINGNGGTEILHKTETETITKP